MFSERKLVVICDMYSIVDDETGDRLISVINAKKVMCEKKLVGIQTQQLAQAQNMSFSYTIEIDRMYYKNQKFLFLENNLYEIRNIAPAKLPQNCKLSITILEDENIKNAIKEWINVNK